MTAGIVAAYFIGSIPFALLLARRCGTTDLRAIGSGNLGAANVMRASGVKAGILVAAARGRMRTAFRLTLAVAAVAVLTFLAGGRSL